MTPLAAQPLGETPAPARSSRFPLGQGHSFKNTPTGLSTADRDGGCEGRAASVSGVNAGRNAGGGSYHPAKLVNVVIFKTDTGRARIIPRPFAAPFKIKPFHDCEVACA